MVLWPPSSLRMPNRGFRLSNPGVRTDTKNLTSHVNSEDAYISFSGVGDLCRQMPGLVVLRIRSERGTLIRQHECIGRPHEVVSLANAVGVCEGEVHQNDHIVRLIEDILHDQDVSGFSFAPP